MLNERIQEVLEFTKSESPYKKANKGWINQDIFLDLSPTTDKARPDNEAAKITLFWSPINRLLSNIFWIIIACSVLVFTSVSFAKGRFDFDFFNDSAIVDFVIDEKNTSLNIRQVKDIDSIDSTTNQNLDIKDLDKKNNIYSLDDDLSKADHKVINKQESLIKEIETNKDIKILKNKKSKSNFI